MSIRTWMIVKLWAAVTVGCLPSVYLLWHPQCVQLRDCIMVALSQSGKFHSLLPYIDLWFCIRPNFGQLVIRQCCNLEEKVKRWQRHGPRVFMAPLHHESSYFRILLRWYNKTLYCFKGLSVICSHKHPRWYITLRCKALWPSSPAFHTAIDICNLATWAPLQLLPMGISPCFTYLQ